MTSSNPNSNPNANANTGPTFRPFAVKRKGGVRFVPANSMALSKPSISQALQTGGDQIQVTWGESGGETYRLQVSTNGGTSFTDLTTGAGLSYTHTGLSFPGSYTYRVRAEASGDVSDYSDNVTETMVDVPAAPGGLAVTGATTSSISLSWNDTTGESSYLVEVSTDGLGSWTTAGTTAQNVVTFTHSGLAESVQRYYRVVAVNKAGGSLPSSTDNTWTVPATPTGLSATAASSSQINLSWTDVSTGNTSYKVERSTDNVNWTEIATGLSASATTYSATSLSASTLYYFRVRAANAARNSAYSGTASATTTAAIPSAPSAFTATSSFADSVSLAWTDNSSNETGFDIEVSTNAGSTYSSVTTTAANATSHSHTGRLESTAYLYRIRATNAAGSSSWVVAASVTTPAAVQSFTATAASSSSISLSWVDKSQVETGFRIEYSEDNFNWALLATTASSATSYTSSPLNPSTTYWYRIRSNSYNGTNDSAWYTASATTSAAGLPTPTYEMNFTTSPWVGAGGRFSRGSRATFINSSGYIQVAEMNLAACSEDLSSVWVRDGLQAFGSGSTVNDAVAPDGTTTADRITETNVNGQHGMYSNGNGLSLTYGTPYTISLYAKKPTTNGRDYVSVGVQAGGHGIVVFNLTNGTYTTNVGWSSMTLHSYSIQSVGDGWYRCIVTFSATGTGTTGGGSVRIGPSNATPTNYFGLPSYQGDGVSGVWIWGVQLVQGSSALPYVRTASTSAVGTPRITHDPVTLAPLGLLMEAQGTNSLLRSQDWSASWTGRDLTQTANAAVSPDGTSNATRFVETTANAGHQFDQNVTRTNVCFSCYVKSDQRTAMSLRFWNTFDDWVVCTFNLANGTAGTIAAGTASGFTNTASGISNAGNGWYRVWLQASRAASSSFQHVIELNSTPTPTRVSSNGAEYYAGNAANGLFVWGAQSEDTDAPPTSYIPTTTATVTRSGDSYGMFATEVASFWNASAGSVVMTSRLAGRVAQMPVAKFGSGGTTNQKMTLNMNNGASPSIVNGGAEVSSTVTGYTTTPAIGTEIRSGFSYGAGPNFKGFVNGITGTNVTSVTIPTVNKIEFATQAGDSMQSGYNLNVFGDIIIGRLRYWNTTLSDANMVTATT